MKVRTFLVVTLVTLLIWLWAEVSNHAARGREAFASVTLARLPVLVAASPAVLESLVPRADVTELADVTIVGPRALVEAVRAGSLKVWATATIEPGDALGAGSEVRVKLTINPGGLGLAWGVAGEDEPLPREAAPSVVVRLRSR